MKQIKKEKTTETCLVISTGLLLLYYIFQVKILLAVAFLIGITGIFIKPLAHLISWSWLKLGDLLGYVVSKIVLSVIYFIFLFPIAILYRAFKKDPLKLKKKHNTYWTTRDYKYIAKDMENPW